MFQKDMPLFDFYIMVDWSGGVRRRGKRADTIWIAHKPTIADAPLTDSPFSRTEANGQTVGTSRHSAARGNSVAFGLNRHWTGFYEYAA